MADVAVSLEASAVEAAETSSLGDLWKRMTAEDLSRSLSCDCAWGSSTFCSGSSECGAMSYVDRAVAMPASRDGCVRVLTSEGGSVTSVIWVSMPLSVVSV